MHAFDDLKSDDLDALLKSPASTKKPPASYAPRDFSEPCPKCRGTGNFIGYSGRVVGPCFTCKGEGKRTFAADAATRGKARERRIEKKAAAIVDFATAHPDVVAWINSSAETFPFAKAMQEAVIKYGSLTDNQLAACQRCLAARDKSRAEAKARQDNAAAINVEKIEQAFATARGNGLKRTILRLDSFVFKPAAAHSKNAGAIYVTEGDLYLGKIIGGKFTRSRECTAEHEARIIAVAADPAKAAVAYGKLTSSCSCCGLELTDPDSIARGIGPICAAKYGF